MKFLSYVLVGLIGLIGLTACALPRPEPEFPLRHFGILQQQQIDTSLATTDEYRILSISGGGPNGAWTAGVVNGWNEQPFDCIIGVSTGALATTPIYLGRLDDLKNAYTDVDNSGIYNFIKICDVFNTTSLSSNDRFEDTIKKYVSDEVIDQVGEKYRITHKLILAVAFDLDAGRVVLWNLGQLAVDKDYDTYRHAIMASAAIPVIFPPVEIGSHLFVDGGARANVYVPDTILAEAAAKGKKVTVKLLLNTMPSELGEGKTTKSLGGVALKSMSSLIDSAMIGNIAYTQSLCQHYGFDFAVGQPSAGTPLEGYEFNKEKMKALYEAGLRWGQKPIWTKDFKPKY